MKKNYLLAVVTALCPCFAQAASVPSGMVRDSDATRDEFRTLFETALRP